MDGFSVDYHFLWGNLSKLLSGNSEFLGTLEQNNNAKNEICHIIGGSCIFVIGKHGVDADMLIVSRVSK